MKNILVSDIMTREPIAVKPETNLLECSKKMVKSKVGSLLLLDKKKLVGFISANDILWAIVKKSKDDLRDIKAIDISMKKIATIRPGATIDEAFKKMKSLKKNKLPVVQEKKIVGMLTIRDILNFRPEFYPELEEFAKIREESEKLKRLKDIKIKRAEGICEECGNTDILYRFNGMVVCKSCMNS